MTILSTTTGNATTGTPQSAAGGRVMRSPHTTPPKLLQCGIVSWLPWRGECLRVIAEQEIWQAIVCKDAKELRQRVFCDEIPLAIVDLPPMSSDTYGSYREQTEWLSQLGDWNGTSGVLLVVCAAGESVQEEIWARQLGVWSYLPLVKLATPELMDPELMVLDDRASIGSSQEGDSAQEGLSLLFSGAREALGIIVQNFSKTTERNSP